MPRVYIAQTCSFIEKELLNKKKYKLKKKIILNKKELTITFLNQLPAKKLNLKYRKKNYATDILSFEGDILFEPDQLGELVLCPQVILRQSKEHELSFRLELTYMLIHGVLHLLGYDHEDSVERAKEMFQLQDQIFQKFLEQKH
jgi:probable rRNA maturation factor